MSEFSERIANLSPKRLALLALELQSKLESLEKGRQEPIAVIGIGCRFPGGADDPESFWRLLSDGIDAITEVPPDRWDLARYYDPDPDAPGKMSTRHGGFLAEVDRFDPHFFNISPREALSMDPQQRLLLEVSWEALEHAAQSPEKLEGSRTGVFVGICNADYLQRLLTRSRETFDTYIATGSSHAIASGRLSYFLGLHGPSLSIDTACSSSLVAIHLACQSLRANECRAALAGGVNLILSPDTTIMLTKARMMAADGRCKAFDAAADGFVRGEGCGIVVLKRLADALADGDRVLALIAGSAVNQDGRSSGITAPNGPAQEAVIREALSGAGVSPADVSYIETHGTGTALGDPIEVNALGAVYSAGRRADAPLRIGSVKTNIGHLESAAGVAGLIKLILAVQHGEIPPHLHLTKPNPYISWNELPIEIPTELREWPAHNGRRIGAVSSFGFSGTNAHIVVSEAPPATVPAVETERPYHLLTLSAKTDEALREQANHYRNYLSEHRSESLADICFSANTGRAKFSHRLACVAESNPQLQQDLGAFAAGSAADVLHAESVGTKQPEVVFLFTGQGAQYVDMGRQLYDTQPTFRRAIDTCDEILRSYLDRSLVSVLYPKSGEASPLDETAFTQPALFALEYALAELWRSWGVQPAAVMGHSVGEYVAACVAGVFSLEDGLKLIAERGRLMQALPERGKMAAVFADEARTARAIAGHLHEISIAALNGPENVVISGAEQAVQAALASLDAEGIKSVALNVSHAFHSPLMEPMLDAFSNAAAKVRFSAPAIGIVSNVTGQLTTDGSVPEPDYWRRHAREAVRFSAGMQALAREGYRLFVEIGPSPTLCGMASNCLPQDAVVFLPSLRRGRDDWRQMLQTLATLYVHGVEMNLAGLDTDYPRRKLALPRYPFERERFWIDYPAAQRALPQNPSVQGPPTCNPLLGTRLRSPSLVDIVFETQVSANWPPFLAHHRVHDMAILPSPAFLEMVLSAAEEVWGRRSFCIRNFTIHEALVLSETKMQPVQILFLPEGEKEARIQIVALEGEETWKRHVTGTLKWTDQDGPVHDTPLLDIAAVQARCREEITCDAYYEKLSELGLDFGSDFRGLNHIWRRDGEALGRVVLPKSLVSETSVYHIHPAFLDACFHLVGASLTTDLETAYLLVGIEQVNIRRPSGTQLWNHTILRQQERGAVTGDIKLYGDDGALVAEVLGLHLTLASRTDLRRADRTPAEDWLYSVRWEPKPQPDLDACRLPEPSNLAAAVTPDAASLAAEHQTGIYKKLLPDLDALSFSYIVQALKKLGWQYQTGCRLTANELIEQLGIAERHHRLFARLLAVLQEEGVLRENSGRWEVIQALTTADSLTTAASLQVKYPHDDAEIQLLTRCGPHLAAVLRGTQDPLHLLFPDGSLVATTRVYAETPIARVYNNLMARTVIAALADLPENKTIRILEIGAGTGATAAAILPHLAAGQVEYVFTDMSSLFLTRAQERFAAYPFVQYKLLDVEQSSRAQGFADHHFDLIIAANVLHATADLRRTLAQVKQLLAPAGQLLLLEGSGQQRWVDLTFGLTEGWWKFTDRDLRQSCPLLSSLRWQELMLAEGFTEVSLIPDIPDDDLSTLQTIYVARGPQTVSTTEILEGWIIFADDIGVGHMLVDKLQSTHQDAILVKPGDAFRRETEKQYYLDPGNPGDYTRLVQTLFAAQPAYQGVLHLWSLDTAPSANFTADDDEQAQRRGVQSALLLAQALVHIKGDKPHLWLASQGAQPVESIPNPAQAPLWGLGRVFALEHPEVWGGMIDLDPSATPTQNVEYLLREIQQPDGEDQIAWRCDKRFVPRLIRAHLPDGAPVKIVAEGVYLVTGGLGGLGIEIAGWLAEQGARHLVLTSRSGLPPRDQWDARCEDAEVRRRVTAVQAIESLGVTVDVTVTDVADRAQMADLFARFGHAMPPLRGVVHAAVAMSAWPIATMPVEALLEMLRPKIRGTRLLHEMTQNMPLDFFVMFSSTTTVWGARELAHYAAANQFMDALAYDRQAHGLPAISINWGIWDVMRLASTADQELMAQFGLRRMPTPQALAVLGNLLCTSGPAQLVVADVEWHKLKTVYEVKRRKPFLAQVHDPKPLANPKPAGAPTLVQQVAGRNARERRQIVVAEVKNAVARVLGITVPRLTNTQQGLFDMGMDSLMSVELKSHLETAVGQTLPSTLTFNYPTIDDLAEYLDTEIIAQSPSAPDESRSEISKSEPETSKAVDTDDFGEDELAALLMEKLEQLN